MLYEQHFIDELKNRADLVRIIEPYAPLKKKGANWMGCCPFHQEKTPSFSVNPSKGFYKCFGCAKGGNAFTFVMEIEGLNFPEAIKRVAEISGVPLPEPIDDEKYEKHKKRREEKKAIADQVIELNNYALEFWESHLQDGNAHSKAAREYLEKRKISRETQKAFRIGFAPDSWDAVMSLLKEKGADEKLIETSGLVSVNEDKNKVYDRFRGRIMFPVLNVSGNPIAFGARILAAGEPKYLNSPETPAYVKGEHLYGLFQSKEEIRRKKYAILVEGYLDLIALYQFGIKNTAASLGTAFTAEQAKLLGRFARRVVINYDGDKAGVKAARRAIETLLAEDFETKVLVLPDGQDPDDFLKASGADAYNHLRGNAAPYLHFVLENLAREKNLSSAKAKAEAVEDVLPILSVIRNLVERRETLKQALRFFQIDDKVTEGYLWKEIQKREKDFINRDGHSENKPETNLSAVKNFVVKRNQAKPTVAEQRLLELVIYDSELREMILPALEQTDYEKLATAEVFRALLALREIGTEINGENLLALVEDDAAASDFASVLLLSEPAREKDDAIDEVLREAEGCVVALRSMAISRRILEISQELVFAEQSGDLNARDALVMEQIELARLKHGLEKRVLEN